MNNKNLLQYGIAATGFIASTLLATGLARAIVDSGLTSAHAAGWVQAVGATAGICIAIWLPYKQREDSISAEKNRRRENAKRLCQSLRDELVLTQLSFGSEFYKEMVDQTANGSFNFAAPTRTHVFPVYQAMVGQLIEIDSGDVRRAIIVAYGTYFELLEMLEINDMALDTDLSHYLEKKELLIKYGRVKYDVLSASYKGRLLGIRKELCSTATSLIDNVAVAVELLNAECDDYVSVVPQE